MNDMKCLFFCAGLLLAVGCSSSGEASWEEPLRVGTLVVDSQTDMNGGNYVGVVEEDNASALSFPVSGTVVRVFVEEGDHVRKGDPIAEVDPTSARQALEAANATLEQARDACARLKQLYEAKSLPEIQWVETQTKLRQAEAAYGIAEKNFNDCKLYAPFSGVVGRQWMAAGETALPGAPVVTLLEIGQVKVRFSVPELEIAAMAADNRVEVHVPAIGDTLLIAGRIEKSAEANPAAHTYDVRAVIDNCSGDLLPGMICRVSVAPSQAVEEMAVPVRAVQQAGTGERFVWLVQGNSVVRRPVVTGRFFDNDVVIISGLFPGDRIVVDGMQKISQGSKVSLQ